MRIDVLTLFPEMFGPVLGSSILKRAAEPVASPADPADVRPPVVSYHVHNIRDWSGDKHGKVDQASFGGGPGMVMQCQPVWDAVQAAEAEDARQTTRVLLTPQGEPLTQTLVEELAESPRLMLICGHYEGIDERVIDRLRDEGGIREISVGDYVLSGGELPAMVLIDSVVRLLPGVLGDENSAHHDSFSPGSERLLDHPHYTRPREWDGREVPAVLLGGDHGKIEKWRVEEAQRRTAARRPDLLAGGSSGAAGQAGIVVLREANRADAKAVDGVLRAAFDRSAEAELVAKLRKRHEILIEVVAEVDGEVVGAVQFSEVQIADEHPVRGFLALAPLAVVPGYQGRGIGTALAEYGLRLCRAAAVERVFVLGEPDFYGRLGFEPAEPAGFTCPYGSGAAFRVAVLRDQRHAGVAGELKYAGAFDGME